jgi:hypothetical protein
MIEVHVFGVLSAGWIVEYGNTMYLIRNEDILFINSKAYTLPNKLVQRYNVR